MEGETQKQTIDGGYGPAQQALDNEMLHDLIGGAAEHEEKWRTIAQCPRCADNKGQWRGYRDRKDGTKVHRRCCGPCGRWFGVEMR